MEYGKQGSLLVKNTAKLSLPGGFQGGEACSGRTVSRKRERCTT